MRSLFIAIFFTISSVSIQSIIHFERNGVGICNVSVNFGICFPNGTGFADTVGRTNSSGAAVFYVNLTEEFLPGNSSAYVLSLGLDASFFMSVTNQKKSWRNDQWQLN